MYREVYIDLVFAANLLMDYILLRLTGIILKFRGSRRRCLIAAAVGAVFSSLNVCMPEEKMKILRILIEMVCAVFMLRIAYRIRSIRNMAGAMLLFIGMTFLTGGFWAAAAGNGRMTVLIFILFALGTYGGLSLYICLADKVKRARACIYPIILRYHERELQTYGLYDTGNLLTDSVTGAPVSVADPEILKSLLPGNLTEKLKHIREKPEEIESTEIADLKPHYLLFETIGAEVKLILAVTLEDLCIQIPGERIHISGPVLALSLEPFALGKEYKVILNSRLLH